MAGCTSNVVHRLLGDKRLVIDPWGAGHGVSQTGRGWFVFVVTGGLSAVSDLGLCLGHPHRVRNYRDVWCGVFRCDFANTGFVHYLLRDNGAAWRVAVKVLFVCLGNICRSPAAEAVFREICPTAKTDSAGTAGWHVGKAPYGPMQDALNLRGLGMSDLRARQFTPADFDQFDLIIAMDDANLQDIEAQRPSGNSTPVHLFTHYAGVTGPVPDPYYTRDFDGALDLIERCAAGLADQA